MTTACSLHPTPERELALKRLGDEIAELAAHLDAATGRLLDLIREFDARGGWGNGFRCCAEWLTWRIGLAPGAAREHVRVARALGTLPRLAQALARGELSYSKVRALTRVATPETEERLLSVGRGGTAAHVERIVRAWRAVDRNAEVHETAERHRLRTLHVHQDEDGMVVIRGRLEPEAGAVVMRALSAAREALYQQGRRADIVPADVLAGTSVGPNVPAERRPDFSSSMARRHGASSRRTRSPCSRRRRSTMGWSREHRESATRLSFMSTRPCSSIPTRLASRWSKARAFPRRQRNGWRATPAASSCGTVPTTTSPRSAFERGRFRPRCAERSNTAMAAVASPAAAHGLVRVITFVTGLTAGPRRCRISQCSVGATIAPFTKRVFS